MPETGPETGSEKTDRIEGGAHQPRAHDSAHKHVSGEAVFLDDMHEPVGLLHIAIGMSARSHARLRRRGAWEAGADTFVAGTAVFGEPDPAAAVQRLRDACAVQI